MVKLVIMKLFIEAVFQILSTPNAVSLLGVLSVVSIFVGWRIKISGHGQVAAMLVLQLIMTNIIEEAIRSSFLMTQQGVLTLRPPVLSALALLISVSGIIIGTMARKPERDENQLASDIIEQLLKEGVITINRNSRAHI